MKAIAGVCALGIALLLAGCGRPAVELVEPNFTNLEVRGVLVRALVLVAGADESRVALSGAFLNTGARSEELAEVHVEPTVPPDGGPRDDPDAPADRTVTVRPDLALPSGQLVEVGGPGDPEIVLPERAAGYRVGSFALVRLVFSGAGPVTTRVQVADAATYLRPVAPTPSPTPTSQTSS